MAVMIMNRSDAVRYCHKRHDRDAVIISISDPNTMYSSAPFKSNNNRVKNICRVYFRDDDRGPQLMTTDDAFKIHSVLKRFDDKDIDIIVHCDAGISRSAGVAAAILKRYTGSDFSIFRNPMYKPNMHCYRMMLNELMV